MLHLAVPHTSKSDADFAYASAHNVDNNFDTQFRLLQACVDMEVKANTQASQAVAALQHSSDELSKLQSTALKNSRMDDFHLQGVVHMLEAELKTLQHRLSDAYFAPQVTSL